MNRYKFEFKEVIYGTIEINADFGIEAEEKLLEMSLKDLLDCSHFDSDKTGRCIEFVDARYNFKCLEKNQWNKLKSYL